MKKNAQFDLMDFVPYLLNQAAESSGMEFQKYYKAKYGMLRTEWRVIFHLGLYGEMTAKDICERARIHKTRVSRAVTALRKKRYLKQQTKAEDRRCERLFLIKQGQKVYDDLSIEAQRFNHQLLFGLSPQERAIFLNCLRKISKF